MCGGGGVPRLVPNAVLILVAKCSGLEAPQAVAKHPLPAQTLARGMRYGVNRASLESGTRSIPARARPRRHHAHVLSSDDTWTVPSRRPRRRRSVTSSSRASCCAGFALPTLGWRRPGTRTHAVLLSWKAAPRLGSARLGCVHGRFLPHGDAGGFGRAPQAMRYNSAAGRASGAFGAACTAMVASCPLLAQRSFRAQGSGFESQRLIPVRMEDCVEHTRTPTNGREQDTPLPIMISRLPHQQKNLNLDGEDALTTYIREHRRPGCLGRSRSSRCHLGDDELPARAKPSPPPTDQLPHSWHADVHNRPPGHRVRRRGHPS